MTYEEEVLDGVKAIAHFSLYQEPIVDLIKRLQELEKTNPGCSLLIDSETFGSEGTVTVQRGRVTVPILIRNGELPNPFEAPLA